MKSIRLLPWTEVCGKLRDITERECCIILTIGKIQVNLSLNESIAFRKLLKDDLRGNSISILRTDSDDEPILLIKL